MLQSLDFAGKKLKILLQNSNSRCFRNSHILWESACWFLRRFLETLTNVETLFGVRADNGQRLLPSFFISKTPRIRRSYQTLNSLSSRHMTPSKISYILSLRLNHWFCGKVILGHCFPLLHRILPVHTHSGITKIFWTCTLHCLKIMEQYHLKHF